MPRYPSSARTAWKRQAATCKERGQKHVQVFVTPVRGEKTVVFRDEGGIRGGILVNRRKQATNTNNSRACSARLAPLLLVGDARPNITTLEGLLAAATMLPHAEQLELLDELQNMIDGM